MLTRLFMLWTVAGLCACPSNDGDPPQGTQRTLTGSYTTTGSWDLSGPFGANTTPGDVAANLIIDELVNRLGVPSLAKDRAFELLSDLGHDAIAGQVDSALPAAWQQGGAVRDSLSAVLATIFRDTSLQLNLADDAVTLTGRSVVTELRIISQGETLIVPLAQVFGDQVTLAADLTGQALSDAVFRLDEHRYALGFSSLVRWILSDRLGLDLETLRNEIRAQVDCPGLIAELTDDQGGLTLEVRSVQYAIASDAIAQVCPAIESTMVDSVLGLFERDSTLALQGRVYSDDNNSDGIVDALRSDADFAGHFRGFPGPVDPVVAASFSGAR